MTLHRNIKTGTAWTALILFFLAGVASSQSGFFISSDKPKAEFHIARMAFSTSAYAGSRPGVRNPMWKVDSPFAEIHFIPAVRRLTSIWAADAIDDEAREYSITDDRVFRYPFLWLQQPGYWNPTEREAERLREYLLRGGFLFVDDFHGRDWFAFEQGMRRVFPDRPIVDIPVTDPINTIFFDMERTPIPGDRHVRMTVGGQPSLQMEGPPTWRGVYNDQGRLMVGINFNMDMGDAWEHADDPFYPAAMTVEAYRLGINYVIYAMTH